MRVSRERFVASAIVVGATALLVGLALTSLRAAAGAAPEPGVVMSPRSTLSAAPTEPVPTEAAGDAREEAPPAEDPGGHSGQYTTTDTYVPPEAPIEVERDDDWDDDGVDSRDDDGDDSRDDDGGEVDD